MLPNLAFSSVSTQPLYEPFDDVALLQTVVLQQDLLERDVEEARKIKRTRRPRRYQTRPWLAEESRRLYGTLGLRQTDGGAQSRRPRVLQLRHSGHSDRI